MMEELAQAIVEYQKPSRSTSTLETAKPPPRKKMKMHASMTNNISSYRANAVIPQMSAADQQRANNISFVVRHAQEEYVDTSMPRLMHPRVDYAPLEIDIFPPSPTLAVVPSSSTATDACMQTPLQLPHPMYKPFKDQLIKGWLLMVDSVDGDRSVCNPTRDGNMRACCCVLTTTSTAERPEFEGFVTASLTGAVYGPQNNSENGWSAWISAVHHRKMKDFRKKDHGPGFINAVPFSPLFMRYRDYLCSIKREPAICRYYHSPEQIHEMQSKVTLERVLTDLFKNVSPELKSMI